MKLFLYIFVIFIINQRSFSQKINGSENVKELMSEYRYGEALALADSLAGQNSSNTELLYLKARSLYEMKRFQEAINTLNFALKFQSADIKIIMDLITNYKNVGEKDSTIYFGNQLIQLYPENIYFKYQLADLYIQYDNYGAAINILLPVYLADTANFYNIMQVANCYYQLEMLDEANTLYRKAIKLIPFEKNAVSRLANISIKKKKYNEGIIITNQFLEKDSDNTSILKLNAYLYYLSGYYDTAVVKFNKCILLNEKSRFTKKYLALSYYKNQDYFIAEPLFREVYESDTTETEICFYLGVSANRSEDIDTSLVYLNKTLDKLTPPGSYLSLIYSELADANNKLHRNDTALVLFKKALEASPDNHSLLFKIAYQYDFYLKRPFDAYKYYKKYVQNTSRPVSNETDETLSMSYFDYAINRINQLEPYSKKKK